MNEETFTHKEVRYCGKLYTPKQDYFLLHPEPVVRDSWQPDGVLRFLAVPIDPLTKVLGGIYSYPRHVVVSGDFVIEYQYTNTTLKVLDLGEYSTEANKEVYYPSESEFEEWQKVVASEEMNNG